MVDNSEERCNGVEGLRQLSMIKASILNPVSYLVFSQIIIIRTTI